MFVASDLGHQSSFDTAFETMRIANKEPATRDLFYRRQSALVEDRLRQGSIAVDVGCGHEFHYDKGSAFVVGVDASFHSIRANRDADLRLYASALDLPLRDDCADLVMCFYSIHHMTGETRKENESIVGAAFREFGRVLKPGGTLLVFDVNPRWYYRITQAAFWNSVRNALGSGFDMHFWPINELEKLAGEGLGVRRVTKHIYRGDWLRIFPPIFSKQWFRVPRFAYPFEICLYEWRKAG